ncbi:hypothetical protein SAMN05421786_101279 [Chryseobacterium ureilyticum]|uniref:Uncharacterized protein n=1 Tax=Chryseobacterium ureilyticum TaxID=373668 RepID=A0A1N7K707_9FLAO|nr:hypothetical protein SAMN05421786_101279 [Chryseobacterium ureilyticum]
MFTHTFFVARNDFKKIFDFLHLIIFIIGESKNTFNENIKDLFIVIKASNFLKGIKIKKTFKLPIDNTYK